MPTLERQWLLSNRVSFLGAGFAIAAWAPIIPFIKERFALSEHGLGLLLLCVGAGSLFSSPLSGLLTSRLGCRKPIFIAATTWTICLLLIATLHNLYLLVPVLFIFGMAAVILEVVSNINGAKIEQITKRTVMSGLHALYSLGGLLGSFGVTFLVSTTHNVLIAAITAALFIMATILGLGRALFNLHELQGESTPRVPEPIFTKRYLRHSGILMISFMLFVLYLTEGAMLDWSGVFLYQERGFPLEYAGYGFAAFAIMMTCCRLVGDRLVLLIGRKRIIVFGTILICLGFILLAAIPHAYLNLLCFMLIGIGSSNVIPQLVSYVAKLNDVPMHIAVTLVNSLGFTGVLLGPAFIGFVAHLISLPIAFVLLGALVLSITYLSLRLLQNAKTP